MKNLRRIVLLLAVPAIAMLFTGCKCEDEVVKIPEPPPIEQPVTLGTEAEHITVGQLIELSEDRLVAFSDFYEKVVYLNFDYYEIVKEQWGAIEEDITWYLPPQEGSTDMEPYLLLPFEAINFDIPVQEQSLLSSAGYKCKVIETDQCVRISGSNIHFKTKNQVTICIEKENEVCSYIWKETEVTLYEDTRCSKPVTDAKIQLARCIL